MASLLDKLRYLELIRGRVTPHCGTVFSVSVVVGAAGGGVPLGAVPALSWCVGRCLSWV